MNTFGETDMTLEQIEKRVTQIAKQSERDMPAAKLNYRLLMEDFVRTISCPTATRGDLIGDLDLQAATVLSTREFIEL